MLPLKVSKCLKPHKSILQRFKIVVLLLTALFLLLVVVLQLSDVTSTTGDTSHQLPPASPTVEPHSNNPPPLRQFLRLESIMDDQVTLISASLASTERLVVVGFHHYKKPITSFHCSILVGECSFLQKKGTNRYNVRYVSFTLHFKIQVPDLSSIQSVSITPAGSASAVSVPINPHVSYNLTACLPTMFNMNLERVADWLNYYHNEFQMESAILYVLPSFTEQNYTALMESIT
ncbi:hypothetical protein GEMRC1_006414 [Eukaryota sp. GEM-RC1]